ncbi:MAG: hypothetical protein ACLU4Y_05200 [Pseudoruminococcus massiliensis]
MDNKLKIREICGDYALDIPFVDGSKPNNDLYNYCPYCGAKMDLERCNIDWQQESIYQNLQD